MAEGLEPGATVAGRYVVESLIGTGGIAEVYRVRHAELGSFHALKVLTWHRKSLADRFENEGKFQAQLGHPNVVTVTDILRFDGRVALVMEFVDGITLETCLAERGAMPAQEVFALFVPILAAVAAAHDRGVMHRDLKPANVLLANTPVGWVPKVADFGIAKFVQEEMKGGDTTAGMIMGSPGYMAPEQIRDSSTVDRRADVFALGAILFEMLAGRRAFADQDGGVSITSTLDREPPRLEVPGVSAEIAAAVRRALARDREQRFADCRAMARGLGIGAHPLLLDMADRAAQPPSFDGRFASPYAPSTLNGPSASPSSSSASSASASAASSASSASASPASAPAVSRPSSTTSPLVVLSFATVGTIATIAALLLGGMGVLVLLAVGSRWADRPPGPLEPIDAPGPVSPAPGPLGPEVVTAAPAPEATETQGPAEATEDPAEVTEPTENETEAAPEPTEASDGVADAAPAPEPSRAEPSRAEPSPAPAVAPAPEVAEPEPVAAAPKPAPAVATVAPAPVVDLSGTWTGKADNRPFELRLSGSGGAWSAEAAFLFGTTTRKESLSGTFDPATRRLELKSGDGNVRFDGQLSGADLEGTYRQGRGKTLRWSVSR
jgi:eukaryotic-like serine/threonine-protein kinase